MALKRAASRLPAWDTGSWRRMGQVTGGKFRSKASAISNVTNERIGLALKLGHYPTIAPNGKARPPPTIGHVSGAIWSQSELDYKSSSRCQALTASCFRILLATDNHIGYAEKDPVRGQDSINTFREILELARDYEVDFILLAGDLFHENRPSRTCMHQVIALLREYTLGDKPVPFELLSDPFPAINYEDPNLNVGIPVFAIHGNHDDPQGTGPEGALCALDVLSVSGTLNYFGKIQLSADEATETEDSGIRIRPVLLRKGTTHLAMYGIGNVKDSRMHYELRSNRVKMYMPEGGGVAEDDWFNMLLIHQNRVKHGVQSNVPEGMSRASLTTSLNPEAQSPRALPQAKHYQRDKFQIEQIPLKTVRPFEHEEVHLAEVAASDEAPIDLEDKDTITAYLREKVKWEETHDPDTEQMMLPLIRLKVETTGAKEMTNPVRFGQDYIGCVANPRDILQYYRKKQMGDRKSANKPDMPEFDMEWEGEEGVDGEEPMTVRDRLAKLEMSSLVKGYLKAQELQVLAENGLENAVMRFVDKEDKDAIKELDALKGLGKDMRKRAVHNEEDLEEHLSRAKEAAVAQWADHDPAETRTKGKGRANKRTQDSDQDSMAYDSMMEEDEVEEPPKRASSKRTTTSAARSTRTAKKQPLFDKGSESSDQASDNSVELVESSPDPAPRKRGATRAGQTKTTKAASSSSSRATPAPSTSRRAAAPTARGSARGRGRSNAASGGTQTQLSFAKAPRATGRKLVDSSDSE
ncbi:meiotic DNA double-strand break processing-related protein [Trichosporon asahii var. asahii CBS 8904]|uniref:Double-strand break repair protein n=2 Tax=Trichosporon asahii var. asahii TaxID=189963 RepID=K1VEG9_TRIAC|nr:meiotic DNA double-strand break processing-related protein [Trichosporon asahii var. asahii CBS 2479]EJT52111.1 meiotic DNA double-strand break processing-related protein [Trichosporon asahii var. asahii CBS 2479]EKD02405.1 meiotic DNA double-strand break processing-related protein [Trichosporon asahii var. asahii CBS 8904]